jgi:hypothetical protein
LADDVVAVALLADFRPCRELKVRMRSTGGQVVGEELNLKRDAVLLLVLAGDLRLVLRIALVVLSLLLALRLLLLRHHTKAFELLVQLGRLLRPSRCQQLVHVHMHVVCVIMKDQSNVPAMAIYERTASRCSERAKGV